MIVRVTAYHRVERLAKVVVDSGAFKGCEAQYNIDTELIVWKKMAHPFPRDYNPKRIEEAVRDTVRRYMDSLGR